MEHRMNLCKEPFEMIASGEKTIELRLYDEKRQLIKVGDTIVFKNLEDKKSEIKTEVLALYIFDNFSELYNILPALKMGYRLGEKVDPNDMLKYYSREQQDKYGVIGIEIKVK